MFKKAAIFSDIHFGKRGDSEQHNQDCLRFVEWFCEQARYRNCDCIIVMGDWFDNRARIGVQTLYASAEAVSKLAELKIPKYFLVGNHDMFQRNTRDIHSLSWITGYEGFTLVNQPMLKQDVMLLPYLVGSEFAWVPEQPCDYVFGHLELPFFLLNEMIEMPDQGGLHTDHFYKTKMVFSGHFHKRQCKINKNQIPVWYIGNCFPHDFNDVGDRDRGCMILEYGKEPQFLNWPDAPNYNSLTMSELLGLIESDTLLKKFNSRSVVECLDDLNIAMEEQIELKESLQGLLRDVRIIPQAQEQDITEGSISDQPEENLEQMIIRGLREYQTTNSGIDPEFLVKLYQGSM